MLQKGAAAGSREVCLEVRKTGTWRKARSPELDRWEGPS